MVDDEIGFYGTVVLIFGSKVFEILKSLLSYYKMLLLKYIYKLTPLLLHTTYIYYFTRYAYFCLINTIFSHIGIRYYDILSCYLCLNSRPSLANHCSTTFSTISDYEATPSFSISFHTSFSWLSGGTIG